MEGTGNYLMDTGFHFHKIEEFCGWRMGMVAQHVNVLDDIEWYI